MSGNAYPTLYEVNTRVWLGELARAGKKKCATLDDVSDKELDKIVGFDWIWLLGVWQTGKIGRDLSRSRDEWRREFKAILPDLADEDIPGSPFAVQAYDVHADFGGADALRRFRKRLRDRGAKLMLDFVPNHTALDHAWVDEHPEFYIQGTEEDLTRWSCNYVRLSNSSGAKILAYGRDPYFSGWPDTLQLNYRHPTFRHAMKGELSRIAELCDGVRCDMAMLVLPEVSRGLGETLRCLATAFGLSTRRFGRRRSLRSAVDVPSSSSWPSLTGTWSGSFSNRGSTTHTTRNIMIVFVLRTPARREHLKADLDYQTKSVRFLENHDEERAAHVFPREVEPAAAICSYLVPGLRFFHDGQFEGRKARVPVHLVRRPEEPVDQTLRDFYAKLVDFLKRPEVRSGRWRPVDCREAWQGNPTWERFLAWTWESTEGERLLIAVNFGPTQGQSRLDLSSLTNLRGRSVRLRDLFSSAEFNRDGDEIASSGLFVDLPAWNYHVFCIST